MPDSLVQSSTVTARTSSGGYFDKLNAQLIRLQATKAREERSVVYFLLSPSTATIKIGTTTNLPARMKALQTAHGAPLVLLTSCKGGRAHEQLLHGILEDYRFNGEWFHDCSFVRTVASWQTASVAA